MKSGDLVIWLGGRKKQGCRIDSIAKVPHSSASACTASGEEPLTIDDRVEEDLHPLQLSPALWLVPP